MPFGDLGRTGGGDFVRARRIHAPPRRARRPAGPAPRPAARPSVGEDADQLPLGAGRVGQRAQQIEDRARAQLDARAGDMAHRRMVARRHQEADIALGQGARSTSAKSASILTPERGQHVGRSRFRRQRAIAVLGHGHAAGGGHQRGGGRDVEGALAVAAGAAGVDGAGRCVDRWRPWRAWCGPRRRSRPRSRRAPAAHQEPADLRRRGIARHAACRTPRPRRPRRAVSPVGDAREQRLHRADVGLRSVAHQAA